jgi:hypothetical protein
LKRQRFFDVIDILKNATKKLKRLLQSDLQECFDHLYGGWQKCLFTPGEYFEGNAA